MRATERRGEAYKAVIPAQAGIHFALNVEEQDQNGLLAASAARPSGHRLRRCSLRHPCLRSPGCAAAKPQRPRNDGGAIYVLRAPSPASTRHLRPELFDAFHESAVARRM